MGVSEKYGTLIQYPKQQDPYYSDPKNKVPLIFRNSHIINRMAEGPRVQSSGIVFVRVQGLGLRRGQGSGVQEGSEFRVQSLGFRGLGFRGQGPGLTLYFTTSAKVEPGVRVSEGSARTSNPLSRKPCAHTVSRESNYIICIYKYIHMHIYILGFK